MDTLFYNIILPILKKEWPGPSSLEIRGVKRMGLQDLEAALESTRVTLRINEEVVPCRHVS